MNNQNISISRDKLGRMIIIKQVTFHQETAMDQHVAMIEDIAKHANMKIQLFYDVIYPADEFSDEEVDMLTQRTRIVLQNRGLTRMIGNHQTTLMMCSA